MKVLSLILSLSLVGCATGFDARERKPAQFDPKELVECTELYETLDLTRLESTKVCIRLLKKDRWRKVSQ